MKRIFLILLVVVIGFLGYVALQPSHYTIYREVTVNAAPDVIFPYINNAQKMNSWNPWMELDPQAKITFSGPEEGVGSKTSWVGGKDLGSGTATVTESVSNVLVKTKLDYTEPFVMSQLAEISLRLEGNQTVVRWSVSGDSAFVARLFCFFMNMDKMIGGTFEKGLSKLKTLAEK